MCAKLSAVEISQVYVLYFSMGVQSSFGSSPRYIGSDIRLIPLGFFLFYPSTCFTHRVRISSICSMPSHHILGWYSKLALTS